VNTASSLYAAVAAWRRARYRRDPSRRGRLARPVVSVGNLRVGGSGKTPVVAHLARLLLECGERPAVLTRGYGRRRALDGVTVVSDGHQVHAGFDAAGDEPLMLARMVPGAVVLVAADRYLAGRLAERRLGATVHLLDDGFQHLALERDVDLLLVSEDDLGDQPLPAGRLREGLAAAAAADAALVNAGYDTAAERIGRAFGLSTTFRVTRVIGPPRRLAGERDSVVVPAGTRVFVVTGIARPDRVRADISSAGWEVAGHLAFRDHHAFDQRDIARIAAAARAASASLVLTTEKDAVRLTECDLGDLSIAAVPLNVGIEPADAFREWLLARIRSRSSDAAPQASDAGPQASGLGLRALDPIQAPASSLQPPVPSPQPPATR
jgi:tetraacyldisaccharide 4'-kinase